MPRIQWVVRFHIVDDADCSIAKIHKKAPAKHEHRKAKERHYFAIAKQQHCNMDSLRLMVNSFIVLCFA